MIVLGMHRSGTSALAGGLEHLGLRLGQRLYQQDEWNPKGYFEDEEIVRFNNALLAALGRRWDSLLPAPDADFTRLDDRVEAAVGMLGRLFPDSLHWGFKDPRMCMLRPFWNTVLHRMGLTPRLLIAVRDPAEVAWSLQRRDGVASARAGWLWLVHMIGALSYVEKPGQARLAAFDRLLAQPADSLHEIARWLGLTPDPELMAAFGANFIEPALARRPDEARALPPLARDACAALCDAAAAGLDPYVFRHGTVWRSILDRFEEQAQPALQTIDDFFGEDRQLDVLESRNLALAAGLANAEALATQRLAALGEADVAMRKLTDAFADAERLAHERHDELARLEAQSHATRQATQEELQRAVHTATALEEEMRMRDVQLRETREALDEARLAADAQRYALAERLREIAGHEARFAAMQDRLKLLEQDGQRLAQELAAIRKSRMWKALRRLGLAGKP